MSKSFERDGNLISYRPDGRVRVQTLFEEPTITQQQFAAECDVNNIMARYEKTGEFSHRNQAEGVFADLSELGDYRSMLDQVQVARELFLTLPPKVRARFQNDPGELLDFIQDSKNRDEAIRIGLIQPSIDPEVQPNANDLNKRDQVNPKEKKQVIKKPIAESSDSE